MSYDEKANVSIDAEGAVLKCAKGIDATECGYVKGAKICAKCGAMPMEMKMVPVSSSVESKMYMSEEDLEDGVVPKEIYPKNPKKKKKKGSMVKPEMPEMAEAEEEEVGAPEMVAEKEDGMEMEEVESDEEEMDEESMPEGDDEDEDDDDDDVEEEDSAEEGKMYGKKRPYGVKADDEMMEDDEDEEEEVVEAEDDEEEAEVDADEDAGEEDTDEAAEADMEEEEEEEETEEKSFSATSKEWESIRQTRIKSMGLKPSDLGASGYVCALERKAYSGSSPVCHDCPGGCVSEKGLPGLLHVEGIAEKMFDGVVIDSGYSADADMFVVDVQTKDGNVKEVFVDGTTAEVMGFHRLDASEFEQKSELGEYKLIDFTEAAEIAVKSIDGHVVAVEPDSFEGFDAYAVEIEGFDGKSYDVFVALDGEILGYDRYEQDEAEEIEAEAAEIAIKRAFSDEKRMELAKEGKAMSDGSYPIVSEGDLRNAIQAYGRSKDKDATKVHIMKRARDLKLESLIPANWVAGSAEKAETTKVSDDASFLASLVEFQLLEDQIENS